MHILLQEHSGAGQHSTSSMLHSESAAVASQHSSHACIENVQLLPPSTAPMRALPGLSGSLTGLMLVLWSPSNHSRWLRVKGPATCRRTRLSWPSSMLSCAESCAWPCRLALTMTSLSIAERPLYSRSRSAANACAATEVATDGSEG